MRIVFLKDSFYKLHKNDSQILQKELRPYFIFYRDSRSYWAIPLRSNLSRSENAFVSNLSNPKAHSGGLDFEKMLIIRNTDIDFDKKPVVDPICAGIMIRFQSTIKKKALNFVYRYSRAVHRFENQFDKPRFIRESSLRHFHKELGLPQVQEVTREQKTRFEKLKDLAKNRHSKIKSQFAKSLLAKIDSFDAQAIFGDVECALRNTISELMNAGFSDRQIEHTVYEYSPTNPSRRNVQRKIQSIKSYLPKIKKRINEPALPL